jgi:predicted AAA+ superfamily ATPase
MDKFYFYDLGIRNILINNLNELNMRNDTGQLWENFIISERLKLTSYKQINVARYFWRTYTGAEMDYVEEREGKLFGYEIKFKKERARTPHTWKDVYAGEFELVNRENYLGFVV